MDDVVEYSVSAKDEGRALYRLLRRAGQFVTVGLTEGQKRALAATDRTSLARTLSRQRSDGDAAPEGLALALGLARRDTREMRQHYAAVVAGGADRLDTDEAALLAHVLLASHLGESDRPTRQALLQALLALAQHHRLPRTALVAATRLAPFEDEQDEMADFRTKFAGASPPDASR
jgi:hypothetical protein